MQPWQSSDTGWVQHWASGSPSLQCSLRTRRPRTVPGQVHVHCVLPLGVLMNYLNSGETIRLQQEVSPNERTKLEATTCAEAPYFPRQAGPPWPSGAGKGTMVPWLVNSEQPADSIYGGTCRSPHAQGCTEGPRCRRGAVKAAAGSLQRGCRRTSGTTFLNSRSPPTNTYEARGPSQSTH